MALSPFDYSRFLMPKGTTTNSKYVYDPQTGEVGRGSHGVAILADVTGSPGVKVVIKAVYPQVHLCPNEKDRARYLDDARKEERFLRAMQKFGGVRMIECVERPEPPAVYIVMEQCDGGSLSNQIQYRREAAKDFHVSEIGMAVSQVLLSLYNMHRVLKVLHRDVKPENVFTLKTGEVKLGDFGLSKQCDVTVEGHVANTSCGTPSYMAPEVLMGQQYGAPADVWSLGLVAYRMMTFSLPSQLQHGDPLEIVRRLERLSDEEWAQEIRNGLAQRVDIDDSLKLRETIIWMLCKAPERRPACSALLRTPFFSASVSYSRGKFHEEGLAEKVKLIDHTMAHWRHSGFDLPVTDPPLKPWLSDSPKSPISLLMPTFAHISNRVIDFTVSYSGRVMQIKDDTSKERFLKVANGELVLYRSAAPEGEPKRISLAQIDFCSESFEPDLPLFQLRMKDDSDYFFVAEDWLEWIKQIDLASGAKKLRDAEPRSTPPLSAAPPDQAPPEIPHETEKQQ